MTTTPMPEFQELNTEVKQLFSTTRANPRVIRLAIRMRDMIDEAPLKEAVDKAVRRYPYLCVRLETRGGRLVLARNRRESPVFHSPDPHPLAGRVGLPVFPLADRALRYADCCGGLDLRQARAATAILKPVDDLTPYQSSKYLLS